MNRTICVSLLAALAAAVFVFGDFAHATTFNDGQTHTANASGPFDRVSIGNSTTLNVLSGANIAGALATNVFAEYGIRGTTNSLVHIAGGSVRGGQQPLSGGFAGDALEMNNGFVIVSGGVIRGGNNTSTSGFAGNGMQVLSTSVAISGGLIQGGDRIGGSSGLAGVGAEIIGGSITFTGGSIIGGANPGGDGAGTGLYMRSASIGVITGGSISRGGPGSQWSVQTMSTARLDIKGGTFNGPFAIGQNSLVNVYGLGLSYSGVNGDFLTGTLQDGSPIHVAVSRSDQGQLILHQVPEPSTVALAAIGLIAFAGFAVRRRRATPSAS